MKIAGIVSGLSGLKVKNVLKGKNSLQDGSVGIKYKDGASTLLIPENVDELVKSLSKRPDINYNIEKKPNGITYVDEFEKSTGRQVKSTIFTEDGEATLSVNVTAPNGRKFIVMDMYGFVDSIYNFNAENKLVNKRLYIGGVPAEREYYNPKTGEFLFSDERSATKISEMKKEYLRLLNDENQR